MLSDKQINQVESLFLAVDSKQTDRAYFDLIDIAIEQVFRISNKQGIYLLWLMNRWVYLRSNPKHLPTRITQCCQ
jgi:hypothetical protein